MFEVAAEEPDGVELFTKVGQVKHCRATRTHDPDDGQVVSLSSLGLSAEVPLCWLSLSHGRT